ncbi:hypothetical protein [Altericista sp. CCNU0014]|uniref:hypothetical protein n=1 Tax=Altericista sp. CCNU0014 TaxID=3082949 RepID=UPI00385018E3
MLKHLELMAIAVIFSGCSDLNARLRHLGCLGAAAAIVPSIGNARYCPNLEATDLHRAIENLSCRFELQ